MSTCTDYQNQKFKVYVLITHSFFVVGLCINKTQPNHVLQYKEVDELFLDGDIPTNPPKWNLVHYKVVEDGDRGRPLLQYIFQRL